MSVENDIRTHLIAQLTGEPTITVQGLPATPDDAIGIVTDGGPAPELAMGPTVVERMVNFSVFVRGARGEGEAVETLMQAVHTALQALGTTVIDGTTYDKITATSEPRREPEDNSGRPIQIGTYTAWRAGA